MESTAKFLSVAVNYEAACYHRNWQTIGILFWRLLSPKICQYMDDWQFGKKTELSKQLVYCHTLKVNWREKRHVYSYTLAQGALTSVYGWIKWVLWRPFWIFKTRSASAKSGTEITEFWDRRENSQILGGSRSLTEDDNVTGNETPSGFRRMSLPVGGNGSKIYYYYYYYTHNYAWAIYTDIKLLTLIQYLKFT